LNDSRVDRIPLLLLLAVATLEDVEGHEIMQQLQALCNCSCMMMAHPHPCSLIFIWLLQNFAKGSIICHSCRSLGNCDMSLLIMLEGNIAPMKVHP